MRLLVFGGSGRVGRALLPLAAARGHEVAAPDRREVDIGDAAAVRLAVGRTAPAAVVNLAAWTDVDGAEAEPEAAFAVNREGAGAVARAAGAAPLVHVSTDFVFDGRAGRAYREDDAVAPLGAYGRSKAGGEAAVREAAARHLIVRTAWLFAAPADGFVGAVLRQGRAGAPLRVVDDQIGCPTPAGALAAALLAAAEQAAAPGFDGWGTYHFAGAPAVSRYGFARAILKAAGLDVAVEPIRSTQASGGAPRPAAVDLDCRRFERVLGIPRPDWRSWLPGAGEGVDEALP